MKLPMPLKRRPVKKPEPDKFEAERKQVEQQQAGLEKMFRRQVKRGVIV